MLDTRSSGPESAVGHVRSAGRRVTVHPLDVAWVAFVAAMVITIVLVPSGQTIPYHMIFITLTLLYGFRLWRPRVIYGVLIAVTVVTGLAFLVTVVSGQVSPDEMAEIPMMPLIVGLMAWHAWRRAAAQREVEELAERESSRLDRQREFLRDSSHAIRTPVTIARGHLELIQMQSQDPAIREDTEVVLRQLDRLHHLAGRLLAIEQLQTMHMLSRSDIAVMELIATLGQGWSQSVPRRWRIEASDAGVVSADPHRLEEAVDALVENAVHFTGPDDEIRISCRLDGAHARIEVADSGPGVPPEDRERVFERFVHGHRHGEEPGTGLGLSLVEAISTAHGGTCWIAAAPEGGALAVVRLPLARPASQAAARAVVPAVT